MVAVRTAEVDDAAHIATVHITAWQEAYQDLVPRAHLDALDIGERTERWRAILSGELTVSGVPPARSFVAETNGTVVGFASVGRFRGDPDNTAAGELWAMYAHPGHWGTGVGDALMATALEELSRLGAAASFLWVLDGNRRARRFYERHGWQSDELTEMFDASGVEVPQVRYSRDV